MVGLLSFDGIKMEVDSRECFEEFQRFLSVLV